ncbi:MAG: hypothetical protein K8F91_11440, partial [Candidatus Obscuribacterales bacterium]|nr:hypothetical protein [Candidatus Obscuribacterales bacterium]
MSHSNPPKIPVVKHKYLYTFHIFVLAILYTAVLSTGPALAATDTKETKDELLEDLSPKASQKNEESDTIKEEADSEKTETIKPEAKDADKTETEQSDSSQREVDLEEAERELLKEVPPGKEG